jgi:glycosyltransferase involved in cell wall biosynthesis
VEHLVRAVALLRGQGVDATLVVAGAGEPEYERALRGLIEREGLSARAELIGFASGVEKVSLLQSAAAFALPTSQENFGYVLFESMAAGTPVVTTRLVDTAPELERSGGAVLAEQSPGAIAQALGGLIGDRARRDAMGAAGRAWTLEFFDEARVVREIERVYARAAARG